MTFTAPSKNDSIFFLFITCSTTTSAKASIARGALDDWLSLLNLPFITLADTFWQKKSPDMSSTVATAVIFFATLAGFQTLFRRAKNCSPASLVECLQLPFSLSNSGAEKCLQSACSVSTCWRNNFEELPFVFLLFGHSSGCFLCGAAVPFALALQIMQSFLGIYGAFPVRVCCPVFLFFLLWLLAAMRCVLSCSVRRC